jgi:hypothetical protein
MKIELAGFADVARQLEALHDCPFDLDQAQYDSETHEWQAAFLRPVWDDPGVERQRRALVVLEHRVPVVEARLLVRSVSQIQILDDQRIGRYTFNRVVSTATGLRLEFNERMRVELTVVGHPAGSYEEVEVVGIRAVYREVLFVQSGPSLICPSGSTGKWAV